MNKPQVKNWVDQLPDPVLTPLMKESAKYDFMLLPPTEEDELWRAVIYKTGPNPTKGKVFRFVMGRYANVISTYEHLTETLINEFFKTARDLSQEEYLAIIEAPEVTYQKYPGLYHSRDIHH